MKVHELVTLLQGLPKDAEVITTLFSEYRELESKDVTLIKAEDKKVALHHGNYMEIRPWWLEKNQDANFVTVVHFSGN
jgi:hypothetical protein